MRRWLIPLGLGMILLFVTGCAGRPRQESWPGLIVVDDILYAANWDRVSALDAVTGEVYWSYPFEANRRTNHFYATPVYTEEASEHGLLLVAGFTDQAVHALALSADPTQPPELVWLFTRAGGQYVGSGVVAEGLFLIGNGDGRVYALDLEDGAEVWVFRTQDRVWATPLVIEDTVYISSLDHTLYAVDLQTGVERWRVDTQGALASAPAVVDGDLWIGDFARTLYQIDVATQSIVWTYQAQNWLWGTPVMGGSTLYFYDVGGNVYALDLQTRDMLWDEPVNLDEATLRGRPMLDAEAGILLVPAHESGKIYALDAETGMEIDWGVIEEDPGKLPSDLVRAHNMVYAMPIEAETRIRALDGASGVPVWVYPPVEDVE